MLLRKPRRLVAFLLPGLLFLPSGAATALGVDACIAHMAMESGTDAGGGHAHHGAPSVPTTPPAQESAASAGALDAHAHPAVAPAAEPAPHHEHGATTSAETPAGSAADADESNAAERACPCGCLQLCVANANAAGPAPNHSARVDLSTIPARIAPPIHAASTRPRRAHVPYLLPPSHAPPAA